MFADRSRIFSVRLLLGAFIVLPVLFLFAPSMPVFAENPSANDDGPTSSISSVCSPSLSSSTAADRYVVSVPELNLRSGPSTSCEIVAELERNVTIYGIGDEVDSEDYVWVPVTTDAGVG